jgi:hypothetical protein
MTEEARDGIKRAALWLVVLLIGALVGAFVWLALKEGRTTLTLCDIRPKFCSRQ